jgi:hypothetical protein
MDHAFSPAGEQAGTMPNVVHRRGGSAGSATTLELLEKRESRNSQLRRRLELRDGFQFLERRRERVGETPDRSRPEFLIVLL